MRTLLAGGAAAWFLYNALNFLAPAGGAYLNSGAPGGIDGGAAAVTITWAARTLFAGLAVLSLAFVEWAWLVRIIISSLPTAPESRCSARTSPSAASNHSCANWGCQSSGSAICGTPQRRCC